MGKSLLLWVFLFGVLSLQVPAQTKKKERKKEFYFSWGYNTEWYTNSKLRVSQSSVGNDFELSRIKGHDHRGWDEGLFSKAISIPQYNYRMGLFLNRKKGIAVEINFDHTKYIIGDQVVGIKGTLNGRNIDSSLLFNAKNGFYYYLNNGANFLLFNIVKRWHWHEYKNISLDFLAKAGIGPVIPHVENSFFGLINNKGFQFGGWNIGAEACLRSNFFHRVFLEFSNKLDYARYSKLKVYEGTARQAFGSYEMILSLGVNFPVGGKL